MQKQAQLGMGLPPNYPTQANGDDSYAKDEPAEIILELAPEEPSFELPQIPGATDNSDIIIEPDDMDGNIEVEEPQDVEVAEHDPWDWRSQGLDQFIPWLKGMMNNVPSHSGKESSGCERAIAYFEALDKEITKAMREDYKGLIETSHAEAARDEIHHGIERLIERLEKIRHSKFKKKKADGEDGIIKEAGATKINGIMIAVPLFVSFIARAMINGHVSAGHPMEQTFEKLNKKYKITDREKAELTQLVLDMGFPIRLDRGLIDEDINYTSSNNVDFNSNYVG